MVPMILFINDTEFPQCLFYLMEVDTQIIKFVGDMCPIA